MFYLFKSTIIFLCSSVFIAGYLRPVASLMGVLGAFYKSTSFVLKYFFYVLFAYASFLEILIVTASLKIRDVLYNAGATLHIIFYEGEKKLII